MVSHRVVLTRCRYIKSCRAVRVLDSFQGSLNIAEPSLQSVKVAIAVSIMWTLNGKRNATVIAYVLPTVKVVVVPACSYMQSHPNSLHSEHFGRPPSHCFHGMHALGLRSQVRSDRYLRVTFGVGNCCMPMQPCAACSEDWCASNPVPGSLPVPSPSHSPD